MDGENNGKPYEQMDDLGGNPLFLETPISIQSKETDPYDHLTVLPESSRADLSSLNFNKADLKSLVTPRLAEAWKKLPVSAVFKTKHNKQNGSKRWIFTSTSLGKNRSVNLYSHCSQVFFQRENDCNVSKQHLWEVELLR